jgi:ribosomal protein S18 acetylase RimI-like enzyme/catechol 2,3-dioxygenase-like lactoylglutathione lyase family enzyme
MDATIRRLRAADAEAYVALRREMLADTPIAFLASPGDDVGCDVVAMRASLGGGDEHVVFGAFADALVGAVGLMRERHAKAAHKAVVWGMYVTPRARRSGIGRRLVLAAVEHARALEGVRQVVLSVSDETPGARSLYESAGFRRWGTEPGAMRGDRRFVDEHHMVLGLDGPLPAPRARMSYLFHVCNDVAAARRFYVELLGLPQRSFVNDAKFGWLCVDAGGYEAMWFRADAALPVATAFACQPGWGGGTLEVTSSGVEIPWARFSDVHRALVAAGTTLFRPVPEWRQGSYWGLSALDPMGATVEVYAVPPSKPTSTTWPPS